MKRTYILALLGVGCILTLAGCQGGAQTTATPEEQARFENPVLEPPPEAGNITGPPPGATGN